MLPELATLKFRGCGWRGISGPRSEGLEFLGRCSVQWIFFMDWFRCRCQPSPWRRRFCWKIWFFANQGMGIPKKKPWIIDLSRKPLANSGQSIWIARSGDVEIFLQIFLQSLSCQSFYDDLLYSSAGEFVRLKWTWFSHGRNLWF